MKIVTMSSGVSFLSTYEIRIVITVLFLCLSNVEVGSCKEWTDEELEQIEKQWAEQDGELMTSSLSKSSNKSIEILFCAQLLRSFTSPLCALKDVTADCSKFYPLNPTKMIEDFVSVDEAIESKRKFERDNTVPNLDPSNLQNMLHKSPEQVMASLKKGKPLMTFVQVDDKLSSNEADSITSVWHVGIRNGGIGAQRYHVGDNRFIFMFDDGAEAFKAKEFIIDQPECLSFEVDNQKFPGRASPDFRKDPYQTTRDNEKGKTEL